MILRRGKRNLRDESNLKFPSKSPHVPCNVALKDHDYIFPCKDNRVSSSPRLDALKVTRLSRTNNSRLGYSSAILSSKGGVS